MTESPTPTRAFLTHANAIDRLTASPPTKTYGEGIEDAAKYHDDRAAKCRLTASSPSITETCRAFYENSAQEQELEARHIRALSPTGSGQEKG